MAHAIEPAQPHRWSQRASAALFGSFALPLAGFFTGYWCSQPDPGEVPPLILPVSSDDWSNLGFALVAMTTIGAIVATLPWAMTKFLSKRPPELALRLFAGRKPLDAVMMLAICWLIMYIAGFAIGHANIHDDCVARVSLVAYQP